MSVFPGGNSDLYAAPRCGMLADRSAYSGMRKKESGFSENPEKGNRSCTPSGCTDLLFV